MTPHVRHVVTLALIIAVITGGFLAWHFNLVPEIGKFFAAEPPTIDVYRLYLPSIKDHLLTTDTNQYNALGAQGWSKEGVNFRAFNAGTTLIGVAVVPMHGLYNAALQQHIYSTDANEYGTVLPGQGWLDQGTVAYILPTSVTGTFLPLYRLFLPATNTFFTTADENEKTIRVSQGWLNQGVLGYVLPAPVALTNNAVCVSVTGVPATITVGGTFTAQFTVRNTGTTTWTTDATPHGLGSFDPVGNVVWGPASNWIPLSVGSVAPGQDAIFTINATAPTTPGTIPFRRIMAESTIENFGAVCGGSITVTAAPVSAGTPVNVYRLYLASIKDHLLTADISQYNTLGANGWTKEGVAFQAFGTAGTYQGITDIPMHGLYKAALQQHIYSTDSNEYSTVLPGQGWLDQGTVAYVLPTQVSGTVPVYRLFLVATNTFFTTASEAEKTARVAGGWLNQGVLGYVLPAPAIMVKPGDVDGDGDVDIFDYNIMVTQFGSIGYVQADLNGDGKVDIFDYNIVVTNFGH